MLRCCLAVWALLFTILVTFEAAEAQTPFAPTAPAPETATPATPDYEALADILADEAARNALIEELRGLASGAAEEQPALAAEASIARQIASMTRAMAEGLVEQVETVFSQVAALDFRRVSAAGLMNLGEVLLDVAVVITAALIVLYLLRAAAAVLYRRASAWTLNSRSMRGWIRRGLAAIGCSLIDIATIIAAWLVGYFVALGFGDGWRMDTRQSLFLNAFVFVETIKAIIRLFLATRYDGLRLLPIRGEDAAYWYGWLSRLTTFVGYSMLFVVPVVSWSLGRGPGQLLSFLVYATALIFLVLLILQNKAFVHDRLMRLSERSSFAFGRIAYNALARIWHFIAIAYLVAFALITLFRPEDALPFIIGATLQSVVVITGAGFLSYMVGRLIRIGVHFPAETRSKYPMLETRLNAFVPVTLRTVRILIALVAAALLFHAWALFDLFDWVASESGSRVVGTAVTLGFLLLAAVGLWLVVTSWIERRLAEGQPGTRLPSARTRTLLSIFRNAFTIALVVITVMVALSEIGLDIGPLLAGAGVLGLAVGFGSQKLVQDVITGVFIQLENAINTGDVVTLGGITGTVEKLTVRSVALRDLSGTYHLLPFSSVDIVANYMRGFGYHLGEYHIAYRENVDEAMDVLRVAFVELRADGEHGPKIMDDLEVHGLSQFADSSFVIRIRIKTLPGEQWGVGRAYNRLVKHHFDEAGIEFPLPHMRLYFGEGKDGTAPAAPIRLAGGDEDTAQTQLPEQRPPRRRHKQSGPRLPDSDEVDSPSDPR